MFNRFAGLVAAALLLISVSAHATDYRLDFTATDFTRFPGTGTTADSPFESATGYALFSADSPLAQWKTLTAFEVTIGDVHYTLSNVGFQLGSGSTSIGGLASSWQALRTDTNDFALIYSFTPGYESRFLYSSASTPGYWQGVVTSTISVVPEPETFGLLLAGLGLLGVAARRRKV